jgi:serine/threonine-protein kinase RsbW
MICNEISEIDRVRNMLDGFGHAHRVDPQSVVQLQVVLDELVSNVIKYGWPEGGRHEVKVCISLTANVIQIVIVDDGRPFNPCDAPAPATAPAPNTSHRPRPGGVGIHMVRKLVDGIEYARVNGRNHVRLTKMTASTQLE